MDKETKTPTPEEIQKMCDNVYQMGFNDGYDTGYNAGFDVGYDEGYFEGEKNL